MNLAETQTLNLCQKGKLALHNQGDTVILHLKRGLFGSKYIIW